MSENEEKQLKKLNNSAILTSIAIVFGIKMTSFLVSEEYILNLISLYGIVLIGFLMISCSFRQLLLKFFYSFVVLFILSIYDENYLNFLSFFEFFIDNIIQSIRVIILIISITFITITMNITKNQKYSNFCKKIEKPQYVISTIFIALFVILNIIKVIK